VSLVLRRPAGHGLNLTALESLFKVAPFLP
jgi:hypothetical protein